MTENQISYYIRGAIFNVHNELGAGLLENIYTQALEIELLSKGLSVKREVPIEVNYKGYSLGVGLRLDLLVENKVIIEVKSVEELAKIHYKQLLTYLKITDLKLGVLVNFNENIITNGIHRLVNNL